MYVKIFRKALFLLETPHRLLQGELISDFEDIRSFFYREFLLELTGENAENKQEKRKHNADKFQLTQNFRTYAGVLKLAQSIMNLLYDFFPSWVDRLIPETSLVYGEAPILLESSSGDNAIMTIFGSSGSIGIGLIGFGAEQVILARDDHAQKSLTLFGGKLLC